MEWGLGKFACVRFILVIPLFSTILFARVVSSYESPILACHVPLDSEFLETEIPESLKSCTHVIISTPTPLFLRQQSSEWSKHIFVLKLLQESVPDARFILSIRNSNETNFITLFNTAKSISSLILFLKNYQIESFDVAWELIQSAPDYLPMLKSLHSILHKAGYRLTSTIGTGKQEKNDTHISNILPYLDLLFMVPTDDPILKNAERTFEYIETNEGKFLNSFALLMKSHREKIVIGMSQQAMVWKLQNGESSISLGQFHVNMKAELELLPYYEACQLLEKDWALVKQSNPFYSMAKESNLEKWMIFVDPNSLRKRVELLMQYGFAGVALYDSDMDDQKENCGSTLAHQARLGITSSRKVETGSLESPEVCIPFLGLISGCSEPANSNGESSGTSLGGTEILPSAERSEDQESDQYTLPGNAISTSTSSSASYESSHISAINQHNADELMIRTRRDAQETDGISTSKSLDNAEPPSSTSEITTTTEFAYGETTNLGPSSNEQSQPTDETATTANESKIDEDTNSEQNAESKEQQVDLDSPVEIKEEPLSSDETPSSQLPDGKGHEERSTLPPVEQITISNHYVSTEATNELVEVKVTPQEQESIPIDISSPTLVAEWAESTTLATEEETSSTLTTALSNDFSTENPAMEIEQNKLYSIEKTSEYSTEPVESQSEPTATSATEETKPDASEDTESDSSLTTYLPHISSLPPSSTILATESTSEKATRVDFAYSSKDSSNSQTDTMSPVFVSETEKTFELTTKETNEPLFQSTTTITDDVILMKESSDDMKGITYPETESISTMGGTIASESAYSTSSFIEDPYTNHISVSIENEIESSTNSSLDEFPVNGSPQDEGQQQQLYSRNFQSEETSFAGFSSPSNEYLSTISPDEEPSTSSFSSTELTSQTTDSVNEEADVSLSTKEPTYSTAIFSNEKTDENFSTSLPSSDVSTEGALYSYSINEAHTTEISHNEYIPSTFTSDKLEDTSRTAPPNSIDLLMETPTEMATYEQEEIRKYGIETSSSSYWNSPQWSVSSEDQGSSTTTIEDRINLPAFSVNGNPPLDSATENCPECGTNDHANDSSTFQQSVSLSAGDISNSVIIQINVNSNQDMRLNSSQHGNQSYWFDGVTHYVNDYDNQREKNSTSSSNPCALAKNSPLLRLLLCPNALLSDLSDMVVERLAPAIVSKINNSFSGVTGVLHIDNDKRELDSTTRASVSDGTTNSNMEYLNSNVSFEEKLGSLNVTSPLPNYSDQAMNEELNFSIPPKTSFKPIRTTESPSVDLLMNATQTESRNATDTFSDSWLPGWFINMFYNQSEEVDSNSTPNQSTVTIPENYTTDVSNKPLSVSSTGESSGMIANVNHFPFELIESLTVSGKQNRTGPVSSHVTNAALELQKSTTTIPYQEDAKKEIKSADFWKTDVVRALMRKAGPNLPSIPSLGHRWKAIEPAEFRVQKFQLNPLALSNVSKRNSSSLN